MQPQPSVRPNLFDWMFAFFLGAFAAVLVFPTTCFGSVMVIVTLGRVVSPLGSDTLNLLGKLFSLGLLASCIVLTILAALYSGRAYLNAVERGDEARRHDES